MTKLVSLTGIKNNLDNIPHMLRNLASEIERGDVQSPKTLLLVSVYDGNSVPDLYQFGSDLSRLEEAGAFAYFMNTCLQTHAV